MRNLESVVFNRKRQREMRVRSCICIHVNEEWGDAYVAVIETSYRRIKCFGLQFSIAVTRELASRCCEIICRRACHKARITANGVTRHRNSHCTVVIPKSSNARWRTRWRILYIIRNRFSLNRNFHFCVSFIPLGKVCRFVSREFDFLGISFCFTHVQLCAQHYSVAPRVMPRVNLLRYEFLVGTCMNFSAVFNNGT